jgi:hypothetical protein
MKEKLLRYATIKELLETRQINTLDQIFNYVPYQQVAADLKMDESHLRKIVADTTEMKMLEIFELARLIGCPEDIILNMAADQFLAGKKQ